MEGLFPIRGTWKTKKGSIGAAESWGEWKHFSLREVGRIYHISCLFQYFPGWENLILSESWIMNHELTQKLSVLGWCNPPNSLAIFIVKSFTVWILRCPVTSKRAPQSCVSASWGYFILVLSSPLYKFKCIKKDLTCQKRENFYGISASFWWQVPGLRQGSRLSILVTVPVECRNLAALAVGHITPEFYFLSSQNQS